MVFVVTVISMRMMMMTLEGSFTRMLQVPNIVRRLADADNLPCRIGHYSHQDDDDNDDALQNHILYVTELVPF